MPSARTDPAQHPEAHAHRAVGAFRQQHGATYLKRLAGLEPDPRVDFGARAYLLSERFRAALAEVRASGDLDPAGYAAISAQLARAQLEKSYAPVRTATTTLPAHEVSVEGETRAAGALLGEWVGQASALGRERTFKALAPALEQFAERLVQRRADADAEVAALLRELTPERHPDAGPEGGAGALAEAWLRDTDAIAREATAYTQRTLGGEGRNGLDLLHAALGRDFSGLFPRDGRLRRLAGDWEPLGLRRLLTSRARSASEHPGPLASPHLVVLAAPGDVRVSPSAYEYGLASELTTAEVVGRAVGIVHASEALPVAVRLPSAATVARAAGALAVLRFAEPHFLRRVRGLSGREADAVARISLTWFLLDSRLAAAAVLARGLFSASALDETAAIVERALCAPVPRAAALLVLRASPGAPLRAKVQAPGLSFALRERFDADWYLNPRAAEPLRGGFARAGQISVEALAEELGATIAHGIEKLSELF